MKITRIDRYVTAVPHIPSIEKSRPGHYRENPITIVEVHTDEGLTGLGEGGRGDLMEGVEKEWVGRDPLAVDLPSTGGAMAMACYDIAGKAYGVPACRLMGARHWSKVPVGWWSPPLEPAEFAAMAEEGARLGYKTHKLKARPWSIVETVERQIDEPEPRQRAEMTRLETERAVDVLDRGLVPTHQIIKRRPLVPALGELGRDLDHRVEQRQRLVELALRHRLGALAEQKIDGLAARFGPDAPDSLLDAQGLQRIAGRVKLGEQLVQTHVLLIGHGGSR